MDRNNQNHSQGSKSTLNPSAAPWTGIPETHKCLYITFSYGNPVTENEIFYYLTNQYGDCVDRIYVHLPRNGPSLFGKITFKSSVFPRLIQDFLIALPKKLKQSTILFLQISCNVLELLVCCNTESEV